jgi:endonuclease-3
MPLGEREFMTKTEAPQTSKDLRGRAPKIISLLHKTYPGAKTALNYKSPLELLIATILSAQSTDKLVNSLTPMLFKKYRNAADWAKAPLGQIEQDIKPTGFFHNKAKSVQRCCRMLVEKFGGKVPVTMEELVTLPGVGRKTANVLLGNLWGKPAITVDTHVTRLSQRLGLTVETNPVKIEFALQAILPEKEWTFFSHAIILHGRAVCIARKPDCPGCALNKLCPSAFTFGIPAPKDWQPLVAK